MLCGGYNTDRVLRAVLSVCRGVTTQTVCYVLSCLYAGGVTTGQHITRFVLQTPHPQRKPPIHNMVYLWGGGGFAPQTVVCCPVCQGWLGWGGVTTQTACYVPSCLSGLDRVGWGVTTHTACYVPSCLSGLVRVGGVTTQTACYVPSCLSGLVRVGWGVTTQTACYVPSCLSGLGCYNTDRVLRAVLSVGVG